MLIRKFIIPLLILSLFAWSCKSSAGLKSRENLPRVENVRFTQNKDIINISYDLLSRSYKSKFNVDLLLSIGDQEAYAISSSSLSGDIGKNTSPGKNNEIKWAVLKDFPRGLQGKNFQFIVNAEKEKNSSNTWLYIVAGSIAAGAIAGLVAILVGGSGNNSLPAPPSRPSGQ